MFYLFIPTAINKSGDVLVDLISRYRSNLFTFVSQGKCAPREVSIATRDLCYLNFILLSVMFPRSLSVV